jgi:hypothetical protein
LLDHGIKLPNGSVPERYSRHNERPTKSAHPGLES